jgi:hypothetical protein
VVGTVLLERIVNFLGQFYPSLNHCTYLPPVPFFDRLFTKDVSAALPRGVGYSPAKARFSSLVLGGLLHPLFFIIIGTARNYPSLLLAYAIAAFARSFWTGEHLLWSLCFDLYILYSIIVSVALWYLPNTKKLQEFLCCVHTQEASWGFTWMLV